MSNKTISTDSLTLSDDDEDSDVAREEEELRRLEAEIAEIEKETAKIGGSTTIDTKGEDGDDKKYPPAGGKAAFLLSMNKFTLNDAALIAPNSVPLRRETISVTRGASLDSFSQKDLGKEPQIKTLSTARENPKRESMTREEKRSSSDKNLVASQPKESDTSKLTRAASSVNEHSSKKVNPKRMSLLPDIFSKKGPVPEKPSGSGAEDVDTFRKSRHLSLSTSARDHPSARKEKKKDKKKKKGTDSKEGSEIKDEEGKKGKKKKTTSKVLEKKLLLKEKELELKQQEIEQLTKQLEEAGGKEEEIEEKYIEKLEEEKELKEELEMKHDRLQKEVATTLDELKESLEQKIEELTEKLEEEEKKEREARKKVEVLERDILAKIDALRGGIQDSRPEDSLVYKTLKTENEKLAKDLKILGEQLKDEKDLHEAEMKKFKNDALDRLSKSEEDREAAEEKLKRMEEKLKKLEDSKNAEIEKLQEKLSQASEVAPSDNSNLLEENKKLEEQLKEATEKMHEYKSQYEATLDKLANEGNAKEQNSEAVSELQGKFKNLELKMEEQKEEWDRKEKKYISEVEDLKKVNEELEKSIKEHKNKNFEKKMTAPVSVGSNIRPRTASSAEDVDGLVVRCNLLQAQVEELENWKQINELKRIKLKKKFHDEQLEKDTALRQNRRYEREIERIKRNLEEEETTVIELQKANRKAKSDIDRIKREYENEVLRLQVDNRRLKIKAGED